MFNKKKNKVEEFDARAAIEQLEKRIFKREEKKSKYSIWDSMFLGTSFSFQEKSLEERFESFLKDFEELDNRFDKLEEYLGIEYFKKSEQIQRGDFAWDEKSEGFRKKPEVISGVAGMAIIGGGAVNIHKKKPAKKRKYVKSGKY